MTTTTASPALRNSFLVVGLAYAAVAIHNVWIASMGGLGKVPMILFGLCQLTPAFVVFLYDRSYGKRLMELLSLSGGARTLAKAYALTAATLLACAGLPYLLGYVQMPYGAEMTAGYPLRYLVPSAVLDPSVYWAFLLLGAPLLHLLTATGEEVLWRGYLLDEMRKTFLRRSLGVVNGVFWGLWHLPMIVLLDWDFPGHPVAGVLAMTLSQVAWSVVMVELRLRTDSLWPAIVMHTVANALTIGLYDRVVDHHYNLLFSPWGALGGALMAMPALAMTRKK